MPTFNVYVNITVRLGPCVADVCVNIMVSVGRSETSGASPLVPKLHERGTT